MTALLVGGCLLTVGAAIYLLVDLDRTFTQGISAAGVLAAAFIAALFGGMYMLEHREHDETETHYDTLVAGIEDAYELEAIEYTDPEGKPVLGSGERVPDTDVLCQSVSTNSPQYTGITTDGQQVSFKVGVPDCRAENPDIQLVVTDTPGIPLTADQLRKES